MNTSVRFPPLFLSLFACCFILVAARTNAQLGTVNFANGAALVNAPILLKDTGLGASSSNWKVELLVQSDSGFVSIAGPVPLETGSLAGYFFGGSIPVPGTTPGQPAIFRLRVHNIETQFSIDSDPVAVTLGGGIIPPANFAGLAPIQVPSPIILSIANNGDRLLLWWPIEASNMHLQTCSEFPPVWKDLSTAASTNANSISTTVDILPTSRFFRLSSSQSEGN